MIPLYKNKGYIQNCNNRGIKATKPRYESLREWCTLG